MSRKLLAVRQKMGVKPGFYRAPNRRGNVKVFILMFGDQYFREQRENFA